MQTEVIFIQFKKTLQNFQNKFSRCVRPEPTFKCQISFFGYGCSSSTDIKLIDCSKFFIVGLLESIECIECVRTLHSDGQSKSNSSLARAVDDISLWHNILRFDVGLEVCKDLKVKMKYLQQDDLLLRNCGPRAAEVHKNLSDLFLSTWCDSAPFTISNSVKNHPHFLSLVPIFYGINVILKIF